MHSSRPPVTGPQPPRPPVETGLSDELAATVSGARRRALRDGDRQIDTAHLLHSLLEADPRARAFVDPAHLARLLGLLVQRSIGYGLRWQGTVEDSGSVPVVGEAGWSPAATLAMHRSRERVAARGRGAVPRGVDLLAALARDAGCRAAQLLTRAGVDPAALARALDAEALPAPRAEAVDEDTSPEGAADRHDFARGIDVRELRQGHHE